MFVGFHLSCTGAEASHDVEDAHKGESSAQLRAASQHMHPVKLSNQDRQMLNEQAQPVNMATGTQDFLCQQLEQTCTEVGLHQALCPHLLQIVEVWFQS